MNYRCDSCRAPAASLTLRGHEWLCAACCSPKATGVVRVQGCGSALIDPSRSPSDTPAAPVAAEASEYGWPRKGDVYADGDSRFQAVVDFYEGTNWDDATRSLRCTAHAQWRREFTGSVADKNARYRYRRITSPTAELRNGAEQAVPPPSPRASSKGARTEGAGEDCNAAVYRRWLEFRDGDHRAQSQSIPAFVRSEVERAQRETFRIPDALDAARAAWDDAGGDAGSTLFAMFIDAFYQQLRSSP